MDDMPSLLSMFDLREQPFAPTADPVYFYATQEHKECLFRLWSSIDEQHGIAVVLGNYGTGKTTLLRKLMIGMGADPERYNTAVVGSPIPSWTSFALLESIVAQFGLRPDERSFASYMEALNEHLVANRHRVTTLIVDDAQNLNKRGQIELLRLVQNLETPQHKLLNLVFFGQLEWTQVLRAAPNFEQRINMTFTLNPLDFEETKHFVAFRLRQAGATDEKGPFYDEEALQIAHAHADGNPRLIVTLCRNALLLAAHLGRNRISREMMIHTMEKTTLPDARKRARVAALLRPGEMAEPAASAAPAASSATAATAPPDPGPKSSPKNPRDVKAADMLLRAAKARQGSG